jgi:hypothetical protein
MDTTTLLIIVLVILLLGGGGCTAGAAGIKRRNPAAKPPRGLRDQRKAEVIPAPSEQPDARAMGCTMTAAPPACCIQ